MQASGIQGKTFLKQIVSHDTAMKLYVLFDLDDPLFLFPIGALCRRLFLKFDFSSSSCLLFISILFLNQFPICN